MGMEINEEEARILLGAIECAAFEQGFNWKEDPLVKRIFQHFPSIEKQIIKKEHREHLWSVVVEQDPRVLAVRTLIKNLPKNYSPENSDKRNKLTDELFRVKGIVMKELQAKEAENEQSNRTTR